MTEEKTTLQTEVEVEELGPCKKRLKIDVSAEAIKAEMEKAYGELASTVATKGFRRGHAPQRLLRMRFGEEVTEQVKQDLIDRALGEALEEKKLEALGVPNVENVEFESGEALKFEVTVLLRPNFELKDYDGLELSQPSTQVTEAEVRADLEGLRSRYGHLEPVAESAVEEGHVLVADYVLKVGEDELWKRENTELPVGPSNWLLSLSEDANQKLVGLKPGEEIELEATLPDDYPEEKYRGQKGELKVVVKEIKRVVLPEVDVAFAQRLGLSSLEELEKEVQASLRRQKQRLARAVVERRLIDKLLETVNFELPEEVVDAEAERLLNRRKLDLSRRGVPRETIEAETVKLADVSREKAIRDLKTFFVLERVANQEKIFPTEDEVRQQVAVMAASHDSTTSRMMDVLSKQGLLPELRIQIREAKTIQYLLGKARIEEEEGSASPAEADSREEVSPQQADAVEPEEKEGEEK